MRAAESKARFAGSVTVAEKLPPKALYEARNAPEEVIREIEKRVDNGEVVTGKDVAELKIEAAKVLTVEETSTEVEENDSSDFIPPATADENHIPPTEEPTTTFSVEAKNESEAAAAELIARLAEHFADNEILDLDKLWQTAGSGMVAQYLSL